MLINVLQSLVLVPMGILLGYLAFLSLLALVIRRRPPPPVTDLRRFAIIVPAHNEELAIGGTLKSFRALSYPRPWYSVVVIADNCTDRTAEIARQAGAEVLERSDGELRGKGYALRWCMDILLARNPGYDAFIVIDADSEAAPDFLDVMNRYLAAGSAVVQCSDMVKPQPGAWSAEMTRIGFTLYNHARPLGRSILGGSAGLRGNGMCFTAATIRAHPWDAFTRAEDLEYGLRLLLDGTRVAFAPEARVLATMPVQSRNAETQRARWEGGRIPLIRKYAGALAWKAVKGGSFVHADALVDLITPALVNMLALTLLFAGGNLVLVAAGFSGSLTFAMLWGLAALLGLVHLFVGLAASGADRGQYTALLHLPRYVFWKIALYARLTRGKRESEWIRTTRESSRDGEGHAQDSAHR